MSNINLQNSLSPTSSIGDKDEAKNDINCFDWRNEKPRSGNITLEVPVSRNTFHYFKSWTLSNVKEAWAVSETGYTEQDQSNLLNDINGFYKQKSREVGDVVVVNETYSSSKGFPGRLYSSNGCQRLVRAVRSNLLSEIADADMRNGQPTVVVYTCRNLDAIKTPTFEDYVENRDDRLPQIMEEAGVSNRGGLGEDRKERGNGVFSEHAFLQTCQARPMRAHTCPGITWRLCGGLGASVAQDLRALRLWQSSRQ